MFVLCDTIFNTNRSCNSHKEISVLEKLGSADRHDDGTYIYLLHGIAGNSTMLIKTEIQWKDRKGRQRDRDGNESYCCC